MKREEMFGAGSAYADLVTEAGDYCDAAESARLQVARRIGLRVQVLGETSEGQELVVEEEYVVSDPEFMQWYRDAVGHWPSGCNPDEV